MPEKKRMVKGQPVPIVADHKKEILKLRSDIDALLALSERQSRIMVVIIESLSGIVGATMSGSASTEFRKKMSERISIINEDMNRTST